MSYNRVRPISSEEEKQFANNKNNSNEEYPDGKSSTLSTTRGLEPQSATSSSSVNTSVDSYVSYTPTVDVMSDSGDETGIKVVVRTRPFNERETRLKARSCVQVTKSNREVLIRRREKENKKFYFDDVFDEKSTQLDIYTATGQRVMERFILG